MTGRAPMRSPGRPGVSRDVQRLFWAGVAMGLPSEDAAAACGVSPVVGTRWFRESGRMPQISLTVSGRYLSLAEREDIALMRAQDGGSVRSPAGWCGPRRPSPGSCDATQPRVAGSCTTRPRPPSGRPNGRRGCRNRRNPCGQRTAAHVRPGQAHWPGRGPRRTDGTRPARRFGRQAPRAPQGPAVGRRLESRADRRGSVLPSAFLGCLWR